jgi:hypothetical protein
LNQFVEQYLQENSALFQGAQGIAGQSPVLDYNVINSSVFNYINSHSELFRGIPGSKGDKGD